MQLGNRLMNHQLKQMILCRPRDRVDPRFIQVTETEHTQGLTNEELAGVRSNLRESIRSRNS